MKKFTHRLLPLALCFTLTLGAFAYRPSEAKAIAGVDDAVVIGALLSAFAGGCGLIFSNNGMTSSELAQGLTNKWNEFKAAVLKTDTTFAGWLGYEDTDALLQAIVLLGGNALTVPRSVARKFVEFTKWFVADLGLSSDKTSAPVASGLPSKVSIYTLNPTGSNREFTLGDLVDYGLTYISSDGTYTLGTPFYHRPEDISNSTCYLGFDGSNYLQVGNGGTYGDAISVSRWGVDGWKSTVSAREKYLVDRNLYLYPYYSDGDYRYAVCYLAYETVDGLKVQTLKLLPDIYIRRGGASSASISELLALLNKLVYPDISDTGEGEDTPVGITGVGDGTATTIEELLQKILEQLQANTLAPTLDLAGTQPGGNTGTDEDAKPYLPYIPQIFGKIKELPGTLANIWESIKGIPAAIAEKIGAFFTTLWGWLQNIIDAITALPAAIAEKIGALFKPDEVLLSEITDTFKGKFGFFSTLKQFGNDLFGMTPETEPPVIWVHLENAESKFGYNYGDKQKIFDMTWYQKYKASVDGLLSGFLWLGYLWLLFKRAPSILNGMQMDEDLRPPLLVGDVSSAPRLGAGDPSIHYGEGFTFRSKGGRRK